jgi:hypothetical protein
VRKQENERSIEICEIEKSKRMNEKVKHKQKEVLSPTFCIYVVQSIISWNGRIVALSCIAANTWSHEMVPCPFFSRPRKKQLRACCIFRKNAIIVRGSFLRAAK